MKTTIEAQLPEELLAEGRNFLAEGWGDDLDELIADALRRYLESHSSKLSESFIREDVDWGLHGQS